MPNKTTKKPTKPKQNLSHKQRKFILIATAILIALGVVYWMTRNTSLKQVDKEVAIAQTQQTLDSIQLDGELVASGVEDVGCFMNSVGLEGSVYCRIEGYKYYRISGDVPTVLNSVDGYLLNSGWRRFFRSEAFTKLQEDTLMGEGNTTLEYEHDRFLFIDLPFYKDKANKTYGDLNDAVESGRIAEPAGDELLYGVQVGKSYYTCRSGSIFIQPCPAPPSEPK